MLEVDNITIRELLQDWSEYLRYPRRRLPQPVVMSEWDVSKVTSFNALFTGCDETLFMHPGNDIGGWKFGPATSMKGMFWECPYVPESIARWDVSGVVNMNTMFGISTFFQNQSTMMNVPLGAWNVSNVTDMANMFFGCVAFNQPLGSWNVSNVENMTSMFNGCASFNQPLNMWNMRHVRTMIGMFNGCAKFNQPLGSWNVSNVENMASMFNGCASFNQPLNMWNVSSVENMASMFDGCAKFNQPLDQWHVQQVLNMQDMFRGADTFNQSLATWNLSPRCNVDTMLASKSFFNRLPVFPEKDRIQDTSYVFATRIGPTLKRATIYSLFLKGRPGRTTIADMYAWLWIKRGCELKLIDAVADDPAIMTVASPIYDVTRFDLRPRVLEFV